MHRILVFQFHEREGPGYLAEYLARRALAHERVRIDAGETVPSDLAGVSGIALMGGPMSANDRLPWIEPLLALVRRAAAADVPVLGHCLGGQLMARALGAAVTRNAIPEIGWFPVEAVEGEAARRWLGSLPPSFPAFHWHAETFAIPGGAQHLLRSRHCLHQGFALGPHLALQCHVEMTPALIDSWIEQAGERLHPGLSVQSGEEMRREVESRTQELHRVADALYERWTQGLVGIGAPAPARSLR